MRSDDDKGFRFGVRTVTRTPLPSARPSAVPLVEFVAERLASEVERPELGSLELIEIGAVYVNDERCVNPIRQVEAGDVIRIHTRPRRFSPPPDLVSRIVAEDQDSLLVEKPAGLPSEPTVDNVRENLVSFLEEALGQRLFLVHRLSLESEGLILLAKSPTARAQLVRGFKDGRILRRYVAYVEAPVRQGRHELFDGHVDVVNCFEQRAETSLLSEGRTTWAVSGQPLSICYRLECDFVRPRPKEVRAYLASIGCPVIGDRIHGSRHELLHAETRKPALAFLGKALSLIP